MEDNEKEEQAQDQMDIIMAEAAMSILQEHKDAFGEQAS